MKKSELFFRTFLRSSLLCALFVVNVHASASTNFQIDALKTSAATQSTYEGTVVSPKGAWCWFADPRALHYENSNGTIKNSYIGYIDVHGNIKATQHDFLSGKNNEVLIRSYFQPDDHNNPTFLVLPDERIMIFYSRHTDEACFYYRVSQKPGDITTLGEEVRLATANNTTYPSPYILSDDPNHIYLCWRGINWHPTIAKLTIPDADNKVSFVWGPYQIVQSTAARPYAKYASNGKDKIWMTYTTGHPDNESTNYVYFNYIDIKTLQLKDIKGKVLSTISNGTHNVAATGTYSSANPDAVVENSAFRNWIWQTTTDKDGNPVVGIIRISADKNTHHYYYAKWTGTSWRRTFIANGGSKFHQTSGLEMCYSGGMAIDDNEPNVVYCSVPVSGTYGTVYEIVKYIIGIDGSVASSEAVTRNSKLNNSRPYIIQNAGNSPLKLSWMNGNYYDWIVSSSRPQGYPTAIHVDFDLPADYVDLNNGLIANEDFTGSVNGTAITSGGVLIATRDKYATIAVQSASNFSISLTPYIYEGAYGGEILKMGNLTYGLNSSTLKPYVKIGDNTYSSSNLLGTSDVWQTQARGTSGAWYTPTKHKYFNLTITFENGVLRIFRNGLIDQSIDVEGLQLSDITIGGFLGWVEDCRIYNRAIAQGEVKKLTETSLSYNFNNSLLADIELENLAVPAEIVTDVVFPTKTLSNATVIWNSSNSALVSNTGLVSFPLTPTVVTLTATIGTKSKSFQSTVMTRNINKNKVLAYTFNADDVYSANGLKYVQDKSGNGNDAIVYGSAQVDGTLNLKSNTSNGFSTNGYAHVPAGILNNMRSATFMARIKPEHLNNLPRIFDFGSASANSIFLRASAFSAGYKYNGGSTVLINSSTNIATGQESAVAMIYDAKTKITKIVHNGVESASATTITYEPYQLTEIAADKRNYIGRTQWWDSSVAANNIDFCGTIDDFMVFDIALTLNEINELFNPSTSGLSSLLAKPMQLFPNPVKCDSEVRIQLDIEPAQLRKSSVEIVNLCGQLISKISSPESSFVVSGLSEKGIYIVRLLTDKNYEYTAKLLVI